MNLLTLEWDTIAGPPASFPVSGTTCRRDWSKHKPLSYPAQSHSNNAAKQRFWKAWHAKVKENVLFMFEMHKVLVSWRQPWSSKLNQHRESCLRFGSLAWVSPGLLGMPEAECCLRPWKKLSLNACLFFGPMHWQSFFGILLCREKLAVITNRGSLLFTCLKALYSLRLLRLGVILLWQYNCWRSITISFWI